VHAVQLLGKCLTSYGDPDKFSAAQHEFVAYHCPYTPDSTFTLQKHSEVIFPHVAHVHSNSAALYLKLLIVNKYIISLKDKMWRFLVVKVNCSSFVFNYNQTHLTIEEGQKMSNMS